MQNIHIEIAPGANYFESIIDSLQKIGFHNGTTQPHDIRHMRKSLESGEYAILFEADKPIGLSTWIAGNHEAEWLYMWILPAYRGKKLSKTFGEQIIKHIVSQGVFYIKAHPVTDEGSGLINSMDFCSPNEIETYDHFKIICYRNQLDTLPQNGYSIRINIKRIYPLDNSMEENPIVEQVNGDTCFEIFKGENKLKSGYLKPYFDRKCGNIVYSEGLLCLVEPLDSIKKRLKIE